MTTQVRIVLLRRVLALFALILMGVTWPLWSDPASSISPRIPWFGFLRSMPSWLDSTALGITVVGLVSCVVAPSGTRWTRISLAVLLVGLFPLLGYDQHRLQPWMWELLLFAILFLIAPGQSGWRWWRWVVISIYLHSGLSKLDASFVESHGQLILEGMLQPLSIDVRFWPERTREAIAWTFPIGEIVLCVFLAMRRTQRWGLWMSVVMHVALIWTLGVGLRHESGVVIWNVQFIVQNFILFGGRSSATVAETDATPIPESAFIRIAAAAFGLFAVLFPLTENIGICDHWPAWAVYSSRPGQVDVLIPEEALQRLPAESKEYVGPPAPLETDRPLRLDAWSFETRSCPLYPQNRYRLAVGRALLGNAAEDAVFIVTSTPTRWGDRPDPQRLENAEVETFLKRYWMNTLPVQTEE